MLSKKSNPFLSRMTNYMNDALNSVDYSHGKCASEIVPMVKAFFEKSMSAKINWDGSCVCHNIEDISEIAKFLAMNTRNYQKLSNEDVASLKKLFEELNTLHNEALKHKFQIPSKDTYDFESKITCISEIICKNMVYMHELKENYRDGMIFQSYENLWKVIHRVNTEWNELCDRGFSLKVFYDYRDSFRYDRMMECEKTEEEKFKSFMGILDGKMKFVPLYRPVCLTVVDNNFKEEFVQEENPSITLYGMLPKSEK